MGSVLTLPGILPDEIIDGDFLDDETDTNFSYKTEKYVDFFISSWGLRVSHVNWPSCDLVVLVAGQAIRVEVKASRAPSDRQGSRYYCFSTFKNRRRIWDKNLKALVSPPKRYIGLTSEHCDIIALVAWDIQRINFIIPRGVKSDNIPTRQMHHIGLEEISWAECLRKLEIGDLDG